MDGKETLTAMVLGRQLTDDFLLIGPMILCYDHLLTLRSEIHFVWGKAKRLSFFLFVVLRYGCLLTNIGMIGLRFGPVPLDRCHAMFLTNTVLLILQNVLVGNILGLRVYVVYNFSKLVLLFLISTGVVTVALAAWSISGETWVATQTSGCEFQLQKGSAIRMAGAWEAQLCCDVVVFVFTVIRSYNQPSKIRRSILSYMLRDGALYFAILALVNLGNILMFYLGDPWTASSLSWFTSTLSVTMVSRLMLHLHQVADLGVLTQHDEETSVHFRPSDEESGICTQD